jgi:hypothetical protein
MEFPLSTGLVRRAESSLAVFTIHLKLSVFHSKNSCLTVICKSHVSFSGTKLSICLLPRTLWNTFHMLYEAHTTGHTPCLSLMVFIRNLP